MDIILMLFFAGLIIGLITTIILQIKNRYTDSTVISNVTASLYGIYILLAAFFPYGGMDVALDSIGICYTIGIMVVIGWKLLWHKKNIMTWVIVGGVVSFLALGAQLNRYKESPLSSNALEFALFFMTGVFILTLIAIVKNNLVAPILTKILIINFILVTILFATLESLRISDVVISVIMMALLGLVPGLILMGLYKKFYREKEKEQVPIKKNASTKLFRPQEPGDEEPDDRILRYCESMEEAILRSRLGQGGEYVVANIKEIVKIIENDRYRTVFFITETDQGDKVAVLKMKKKLEDTRSYYSLAMYSVLFSWKNTQLMMSELGRYYDGIDLFRESIKAQLSSSNGKGNFNIEDVAEKLKWGLYNKDIVKGLKINGEGPTEIIDLILDGEAVYLWYYENIPSDDNEIDHLIIEY